MEMSIPEFGPKFQVLAYLCRGGGGGGEEEGQKFKSSKVQNPKHLWPSGRVASPGPKARDEGLDREARGL